MTPQLVSLGEGPSLTVDKPILLVGRHQECDVQIPSRKISRKHCCIAQVGDHLFVKDLQSTNGVQINGVRVGEGKLRHGDELQIGNMRYRVEWSANGSSPAAEAAPKAQGFKVSPALPRIAEQPEGEFLSTESPILLREENGMPPAKAGFPLALAVPNRKDKAGEK